MVYLPKSVLELTEFPQAYKRDIQMQLRLIKERWERFFPLMEYEVLKSPIDTAPETIPEKMIGGTGQGAWDLLWSELVDEDMGGQDWTQPHASGVYDASETAEYEAPVSLHMQLRKDDENQNLEKYGFDHKRFVTIYVPAQSLDLVNITAKPGDRVTWDNEKFFVKWAEPAGWWKNTNLRLYVEMICEHQHFGS